MNGIMYIDLRDDLAARLINNKVLNNRLVVWSVFTI